MFNDFITDATGTVISTHSIRMVTSIEKVGRVFSSDYFVYHIVLVDGTSMEYTSEEYSALSTSRDAVLAQLKISGVTQKCLQ